MRRRQVESRDGHLRHSRSQVNDTDSLSSCEWQEPAQKRPKPETLQFMPLHCRLNRKPHLTTPSGCEQPRHLAEHV